jgi:2-keto-4-pentenoate hydratase
MAVLLAVPAQALCPGEGEVRALAQAILDRQPILNYAGYDSNLSLADGYCAQNKLVDHLIDDLGNRIGWKAALTNPVAQQRFGVDRPLLGVLFQESLMPSPAEIPINFATRPVLEADLLVVVKDKGIHDAKTDEAILEHLSAVIPFVELPDLMVSPAQPLNAPLLVALNAGVRLGVTGIPIPVEPSTLFSNRLSNFTVTVTSHEGRVMSQGAGHNLGGHPLNVVRWMAESVKAQGQELDSGDVLSLGSLTLPFSPEAGQTYHVLYQGLADRSQRIEVRFVAQNGNPSL